MSKTLGLTDKTQTEFATAVAMIPVTVGPTVVLGTPIPGPAGFKP